MTARSLTIPVHAKLAGMHLFIIIDKRNFAIHSVLFLNDLLFSAYLLVIFVFCFFSCMSSLGYFSYFVTQYCLWFGKMFEICFLKTLFTGYFSLVCTFVIKHFLSCCFFCVFLLLFCFFIFISTFLLLIFMNWQWFCFRHICYVQQCSLSLLMRVIVTWWVGVWVIS